MPANPEYCSRVGSHSDVITEALFRARPEWRQRELVDDLRVTALYAERGHSAVCLVSYDVCEIPRAEAATLRLAVADALGRGPRCVHVYCTHNHSSSINKTEHDLDSLAAISAEAARKARDSASKVSEVQFLRVNTGLEYTINRRTQNGPLGTWCLMQSRGCTDDGDVVDGTDWVRENMAQAGASPEELAAITGPFLATRKTDPFLDLVLFPKEDGAYAGGLVRFTAHPVICSATYWRPNIGRDYPGVLCDALSAKLDCPILFLQGPCGDHRPRHRDVGIAERDRIGLGLAGQLIEHLNKIQRYPFDRLENLVKRVTCTLNEELPPSADEAREALTAMTKRLDSFPHDPARLKERKSLAEDVAFLDHAVAVLEGRSYLSLEEVAKRQADCFVSRVSFGSVRLLSFPGELFSTAARGLQYQSGRGNPTLRSTIARLPLRQLDPEKPTVVVSFADGVTGYLMPDEDFREGGYERTWALFQPESVTALRTEACAMAERMDGPYSLPSSKQLEQVTQMITCASDVVPRGKYRPRVRETTPPRERILAVYRGEKPDVVPFMLDLSHWFYQKNRMPWDLSASYEKPEYDLIDYHRKMGVGFYLPNLATFYTVRYPDDVQVHTFKSADGRKITWEFETPLGIIRRQRKWNDQTYSWGISQWGIKTERDLKALGYALARRTYAPRWDLYRDWDDYVGDAGVVYMLSGYSAMGQLLHYWLGIEGTVYAIADWHDTLREVVDAINVNCLELISLLAESPAEIICMGDNFSSDIQPPYFFDEWSRPYYSEAIRYLHAAGKYVAVHIDGKLRGALETFRELRADCADAVTPTPMGDLNPNQCRAEAGPDMILSGGVSPDLWLPHTPIERFKEAVIRWLDLKQHSPRLIANAGDQVPPGASEEHITLMRDLVQRHGRY